MGCGWQSITVPLCLSFLLVLCPCSTVGPHHGCSPLEKAGGPWAPVKSLPRYALPLLSPKGESPLASGAAHPLLFLSPGCLQGCFLPLFSSVMFYPVFFCHFSYRLCLAWGSPGLFSWRSPTVTLPWMLHPASSF